MAYTQGYPITSTMTSFYSAEGVEIIEENDDDFYTEWQQQMWRMMKRTKAGSVLSVYADAEATFKVTGGYYYWGDTIKSFAGSVGSTNPTNNDTTYVYMLSDNTIGSAIDAVGWPDKDHIKLAMITDVANVITNISDLRPMLRFGVGETYDHEGTECYVYAMGHWNSASPADNDEIRIPFYGEDSADNKQEYARLTVVLSDVSSGTENAVIQYSSCSDSSALTNWGELVALTNTCTITNKSINSANNVLSNITSSDIAAFDATEDGTGGIPVIWRADIVAGNTVSIHDAAPYAFRVIDAWSICTTANAGATVKVNCDDSGDITDAWAVTNADKTVDRCGTIDDAFYEVGADSDLRVIGDGANADAEVYVMAVRI